MGDKTHLGLVLVALILLSSGSGIFQSNNDDLIPLILLLYFQFLDQNPQGPLDETYPEITLYSPENCSVIKKPAFINLSVTDNNLNPSAVLWRANVTQTHWVNNFINSFDIDLTNFDSNQAVKFWVKASDYAENMVIIVVILTFDDCEPIINLDIPNNVSVVKKPNFINLTICDEHLNESSAEWKANVTQITWSRDFIGSYDILITRFDSNQAVQFWVRANDTVGNNALITFILTFDDIPPTKPSNLILIVQSTILTLIWTPSIDENEVNYQIWRNGTCIGTTTSNFYVDSNVTTSKVYIYKIIPIDEAGNIGESATINVTTPIEKEFQFDLLFLLFAYYKYAPNPLDELIKIFMGEKKAIDSNMLAVFQCGSLIFGLILGFLVAFIFDENKGSKVFGVLGTSSTGGPTLFNLNIIQFLSLNSLWIFFGSGFAIGFIISLIFMIKYD
ncbi:MAG: hypothetical protein ACTSRG_25175 [Candidatus Helarchaeota archaeon]